MNTTKDQCENCGANATLRYPGGTIQCVECGHEAKSPHATGPRPLQPPVITVARYCRPGGYPSRNFAIHVDGDLLAVTTYKKGAVAVKEKLMELLNGGVTSSAPTATTK